MDLILHVYWHSRTAVWYMRVTRHDRRGSHGAYITLAGGILEAWIEELSKTTPKPMGKAKARPQPDPYYGALCELHGLAHTPGGYGGQCPEVSDFCTHTWWTGAKNGVYARLTPTERRLLLELVFVFVESSWDRTCYGLPYMTPAQNDALCKLLAELAKRGLTQFGFAPASDPHSPHRYDDEPPPGCGPVGSVH
jgi:hypothetical protein